MFKSKFLKGTTRKRKTLRKQVQRKFEAGESIAMTEQTICEVNHGQANNSFMFQLRVSDEFIISQMLDKERMRKFEGVKQQQNHSI